MYSFELECLSGCKVGRDNTRIYTTVECYGEDLEDCLANATVGIEDYHGNFCGHEHVTDLRQKMISLVSRKIAEKIAECAAEMCEGA